MRFFAALQTAHARILENTHNHRIFISEFVNYYYCYVRVRARALAAVSAIKVTKIDNVKFRNLDVFNSIFL